MQPKQRFIFWTAVLILTLLVSQMDRQDNDKRHELYCKMVAEKTWPDYKHIFKRECK